LSRYKEKQIQRLLMFCETKVNHKKITATTQARIEERPAYNPVFLVESHPNQFPWQPASARVGSEYTIELHRTPSIIVTSTTIASAVIENI
jgi:hypothetical protein